MSALLYYSALLLAGWFQLPPMLKKGQFREAAAWLAAAAVAAVLGAVWLWAPLDAGLADLVAFR